MLISSSRRKLVLQGLSAIAGAATLIRPSRAQAPAGPTGVASKLTPGPSGIESLDYDPPRRWAAGSRVGDIAYLAGVTPRHPATGQCVDGTIEQQTELVCQNIQAALTAFGTDFANVFKVTVYLTNMDDLVPVARVRAVSSAAHPVVDRRCRSSFGAVFPGRNRCHGVDPEAGLTWSGAAITKLLLGRRCVTLCSIA
jgi:enamine deaminase RidA (YjgF/YER057c/UK114 family)